MSDPFVHLHVASGYSLRYGTTHPADLVARAADLEMDTLGLTDRDGCYGAVRFAKACLAAGVRPVLGTELSVAVPEPTTQVQGVRRRTPARGGASRAESHQRIILLASGKSGWSALCRLVSATHLRGERGQPVATPELLAEHAADGSRLLVLLGPRSHVGDAIARRRYDQAARLVENWRHLLGEALRLELVSHRLEGHGPMSTVHAARMFGLATDLGVPSVLTNAVRYLDPVDARTADVLDASRQLVALSARHVAGRNTEARLKSGKEMSEVASEIARMAGQGEVAALRLTTSTRTLADRCALDPRADLGLGEVHFPELEVVTGNGYTGTRGGINLATGGDAAATAMRQRADAMVRERCEAGMTRRYGSGWVNDPGRHRLDEELAVIATLGFASYFLTVADVCDVIREMGVRCAARGSGAGSLVNYALGVSGVDPIANGLLMERFLSPLRQSLPDIDIDVESARRLEVYDAIFDRYSADRVACVAMLDTYKVRHAIRDVGAALGMPPGEIDTIAKAFPHIRARDARNAMAELPELRTAGISGDRLGLMFDLVEKLDGLPRHVALHPCGVLLSDATLLDRTPVEASFAGYPMSQFDKDDVEDIGLLKLDVLGIRMQSAMAHAVDEVERIEGVRIDIDDRAQVPFDDNETYRLIGKAHTLGCFQIESPGQRELVGKFGPESFGDIVIDISLFRPGPVKSDMVNPFLRARQGWSVPQYLHPDLEPYLAETGGVVVFHEQVLQIIATFTGCSLAEADEYRRALGDRVGQQETRIWFYPRALERGYQPAVVDQVWALLEAFASFGFCKAHAAAFALPTYQSAWLKTHYPAHFLAGVLTHDPGMYPKRLILDDARQCGITVLGLDVNASDAVYRVERVDADRSGPAPVPDGRGFGIRMALAEVKGINEAEIARVLTGRPFHSLPDFWHRARVSRPVAERLVLAGAFDTLYGIGGPGNRIRRRDGISRRDLLLQVTELDRAGRVADRFARGRRVQRSAETQRLPVASAAVGAATAIDDPALPLGVRALAAAQARTAAPVEADPPMQLALHFPDERDFPGDRVPAEDGAFPEDGDFPEDGSGRVVRLPGLPELSDTERVRAELDILGMDVSRHVLDFYAPMLQAIGITRAVDLRKRRSRSELLVAGVKVATQTPPIRSGRRVVFLTLDDATGPVDATFFEDVQGPYAATVFSSWLLVVRGELRRTGPNGVSLRATGAWELSELLQLWNAAGTDAVLDLIDSSPAPGRGLPSGAGSVLVPDPADNTDPGSGPDGSGPDGTGTAGGMGRRRVLVHPSGFRQSPYADVKPPGESTKAPPRKLWHSSPGSSGH